jgi:hypothetical protein
VLLPGRKSRSLFDVKVVSAYFSGTIAGALLTSLAAWTVSGFSEPIAREPRLALLLAAVLAAWVARQGFVPGFSLPESRRQIPAETFGGGLVRGAFRFGFELGTGLRTYVPAIAPYVLLLVILIGRPTLGVALMMGIGFGLGRAVPLTVQFAAGFARVSGEPPPRMPAFLTSPLIGALILAGAFTLV